MYAGREGFAVPVSAGREGVASVRKSAGREVAGAGSQSAQSSAPTKSCY